MNDLIVPLTNASRRVEADNTLGKEIVARPAPSEKIVARRAHGQVQEPAGHIETHRRPHVGVSGELPGVRAPGLVPEILGLRYRVKTPNLLASVRIKGANVARRIVVIDETIPYRTAENYQVLVHHRRRGLRVVQFLDRPNQALAQIDYAVFTKRCDARSRVGIETDETVPRV